MLGATCACFRTTRMPYGGHAFPRLFRNRRMLSVIWSPWPLPSFIRPMADTDVWRCRSSCLYRCPICRLMPLTFLLRPPSRHVARAALKRYTWGEMCPHQPHRRFRPRTTLTFRCVPLRHHCLRESANSLSWCPTIWQSLPMKNDAATGLIPLGRIWIFRGIVRLLLNLHSRYIPIFPCFQCTKNTEKRTSRSMIILTKDVHFVNFMIWKASLTPKVVPLQHLLIVSLSSGCGICYCKGAYSSVIATNVLGGRRSRFSVIDGWQATILAVKGRMLLFFIPMEGATEFLWHFFCFLCRGVRRHKPYSAPIVLHPTGKEKSLWRFHGIARGIGICGETVCFR